MKRLPRINTGLDIHILQVDIIFKVLTLMAISTHLLHQQQLKLRAEYSLIGQVLLWKLYQDGK